MKHQVVARFSATSALNHGCQPLIKHLANEFFKINRLQNFLLCRQYPGLICESHE
jgi:hypothetical protein